MSSDDLIIDQGVDGRIEWPVTDEDKLPVDLSDWTVQMQVRNIRNVVVHEWSTEDGNVETGLGVISVFWSSAESAAWDWDEGYYNLEVTDPEGRVARIKEGFISVSREITR